MGCMSHGILGSEQVDGGCLFMMSSSVALFYTKLSASLRSQRCVCSLFPDGVCLAQISQTFLKIGSLGQHSLTGK